MKSSRFRYSYRDNASKLHRMVGDFLRGSKIFGGYEIYQEYPVNRVNPHYDTGRHHFDWVIPALKLVVECHGEQHYKVVNFGYDTEEEARAAFLEGKQRDQAKCRAAMDAGYAYIVIPYTVKEIDEDEFFDLYEEATEYAAIYLEDNKEDIEARKRDAEDGLVAKIQAEKKTQERARRDQYLKSEEHRRYLELARKARQERYRRLKELKDGSRS